MQIISLNSIEPLACTVRATSCTLCRQTERFKALNTFRLGFQFLTAAFQFTAVLGLVDDIL
jgi:hypothetical protein